MLVGIGPRSPGTTLIGDCDGVLLLELDDICSLEPYQGPEASVELCSKSYPCVCFRVFRRLGGVEQIEYKHYYYC